MLTMGNRRTKRTGIGKRLTTLRDRLKLSQVKAAKITGVSLRLWGSWERGEAEPSQAMQLYIASVLGKF